jgi:hypothetical protein
MASPNSKNLTLVLMMAAGLMFAWLGSIETYRWRLLHGSVAETQASVTAARRNPSHKAFSGPPYQLQYQFRSPPNGELFGYTGQMLFFARWVRVPEATWVLAGASKQIPVRYSLSDPRINQPTSLALPTLLNAIGFLVFSCFSFGVAIATYRGGKSNNSFKPKPLRGSA